MERPKRLDLAGLSPITRLYHNAVMRNAVIDEFETYLESVGFVFPEEVAEVEVVSVEPEIVEGETSFEIEVPEGVEVEVILDDVMPEEEEK